MPKVDVVLCPILSRMLRQNPPRCWTATVIPVPGRGERPSLRLNIRGELTAVQQCPTHTTFG